MGSRRVASGVTLLLGAAPALALAVPPTSPLVAVVCGAIVIAAALHGLGRGVGALVGDRDAPVALAVVWGGAAYLGIAGAVLGVALGLGLAFSFTKFALNPDGTPVIALFIDPAFISLSGVIAVVSATLASLIPARRSARLDPMEVIRNG